MKYVESTGETATRRQGRRPVTTHAELSDVAIELFVVRGYTATSAEAVAEVAGVSRRTLFRYFPSKADLVWGEFDDAVARMRHELAAVPPDEPLLAALRRELVRFNTVPPAQQARHRQRMRLIMNEPEILARSPFRYRQWREAVAEFAASRLGVSPDSLLPRALGHALLGVSLASYEQWLREDGELTDLIDQAARSLESGFALP